MTMIELVASLALFVIIFGTLLTILDSATTLWSSSHSQESERSVAKNMLDVLSDDLENAVTDNGVPSNTLAVAYPTFVLDSRTNQPLGDVQILLQFARHAKPQTSGRTATDIPLSLDAVFYTLYGNALFRHAIPLSYTRISDAKPLGELLNEKRTRVENSALHAAIVGYAKDPANHSQPAAKWSYSLLAERLDILSMLASLPEAYARKPPDSRQISPAQTGGSTVSEPPLYDYLKSDVLPDHIDIALRLHNEEDWATLLRLENDSSDKAEKQRQNLGLCFSKRITFPSQGGSRLP